MQHFRSAKQTTSSIYTWTSGISITRAATIATRCAHHSLCDHGTVEVATHLIVEDLNVYLMKAIGIGS